MTTAYERIVARPWPKRLRHRRRDLAWRAELRFGKGYGPVTRATAPASDYPELAVGAVALGAKYRDWCLTMLRSLRGRGGYDGPVYIVTDDAAAFSGEANVCVIAVPEVRPRLVAKTCKLLLLGWVTEPVFLYLDADVIMSGALGPWYEQMRPLLQRHPVLCYEDINPFEGAYHSGIILTDRPRAQPIYSRWLEWIRTGRYQFDQEALAVTADAGGIGHMPSGDFGFLRTLLADESQLPRFIHVTNGLIRKYPEDELRTYLMEAVGIERLPESFGREA